MNFKRKSRGNFGKNSENIFKIFRSKKSQEKRRNLRFYFAFLKNLYILENSLY